MQGRTADTIYDLFFAERKAVAAIVLHPSDLARMYKPDPLTLFLGGTLRYKELKIVSERVISKRRMSFRTKSIDEILAMHEANIELNYEDIESVAIKKNLFVVSLEFKFYNHEKRKMFFSLKRNQIAEAEKVIRGIFPKMS